MDYESLLFEIAPWTKETMQSAKLLNNGSFMRGRTGWIRKNIENPESIYEHSCKVGIASHYLFGTKEAVAKGIVHDFPEIFEPDHIPWEIDPRDKKEKEFLAMRKLKEIIPNGGYWFNEWSKFENKIGIGSKIFELDKLCPAIQARDYLRIGKNNLDEFYHYARKKLETPELIELLDDLYSSSIPKNESTYQSYFNGLEKIKL
jgi:5'-deoxynucleotidase YfbR-like HD superfamily hydrolase